MPFTVDDTPFGSLSVTLADVDSTLAASIMATAPATLSLSVYGAAPGVPLGGTTGQVLKKNSNADWDTTWGTDLASAAWGTITGTLSSQTDLQTALDLKAPLASPALTGVPTAPTAATLTSTTQIATTAFVQQELAAGTAVAKNLEVYVRNQTGATLAAGTIVYIDGATGNRPTVTKAQANNDANSAQTFGFTKTSIANNGFGYVIVRGEVENLDTSALTEGQQLYLSPTTSGTWTTTKPSAPQHLVYVGIVVRAHPTQGVILVAIQNGYELNELHDVKITSVSNGQVLKYDSAQGLWVNGTDSAGVAWGGITGTLSNQTDLQIELGTKFNRSGGAFDDGATITMPSTAGGAGIEFATAQMTIESNTAATEFTYVSYNQVLVSDADGTTMHSATGITFPDATFQSTAYPGSSGFLLKSGNLSGLADTSVARSNLGLGTMATETASNYLTTATASSTYAPLASPALTGTPTAPTAAVDTNTTQLATTAYVIGQGYLKSSTASSTYAPLASPALTGTPTAPTAAAATNTTQIATTAFVQQEVPSASTSTAGKVQLETYSTPTPTSTTTAVTPAVLMDHLMHSGYRSWNVRGTNFTSGTGASIGLTSTAHVEIVGPNVSTAGYAMAVWDTGFAGYGMWGMTRGQNMESRAWNKKIWASGRGQLGGAGTTSFNGDANCKVRVSVGGKSSAGSGNISTTEPGFGWYFTPGSAIVLQVSKGDGTAVTDVTSSFTPTARQIFDWKMYSDGAGNVTLYVNDSQVATTTAGPSTSTAEANNFYFEMVEQTASAATRIAWETINPKIYWGV